MWHNSVSSDFLQHLRSTHLIQDVYLTSAQARPSFPPSPFLLERESY